MMSKMIPGVPVVVFAYNFPHKKTQDFLFTLKVLGVDVRLVLAADPVNLKIPPPSIRTKIRHIGLLHPKEVADALGFPYKVIKHNSAEVPSLVSEVGATLGVIAGARILKSHVISAFPLGIVNFHPGLLPEARGLDAVLWSILEGVPLGVTAHLIDENIDAGVLLVKKKIPLYCDDTIFDLTERVYETQLELLGKALSLAAQGKGEPFRDIGRYHRKMPPDLEYETLLRLPSYLKRFANCKEAQ